ncbi:hypothetical protein CLV58_108158 [Spirosoma oryzae]|uniref:Uncharacterized protein n=1 Tax=Spirosoma oryzae TaxID=1469603 RepID=A0A2T0T0R8_9BACT|nr:hypothetical protein [Spirosoma oryzae]PRY39268.1 hypothetical protein CLV58_108158 [Spirosoma oryzae]
MKTLDQFIPAIGSELDAASQQQTGGGFDDVSFARLPIAFPRPLPPIDWPIRLPPINLPIQLPIPFATDY